MNLAKWDVDGRPKKPTIVGIGAQKAGTTWLSTMLGQHPGVWAPPVKEAQFFSHMFDDAHREWIPWHYKRSRQMMEKRLADRGRTLSPEIAKWFDRITRGEMFTNHWYKTLYAPAPEGLQPMDVTPEYSTLSDEGVDYIARFLPTAKFIYIVRHPVDRAISQIKMNLTRKKVRPASDAEWLAFAEDPTILNRGDYATYIPRWRHRFGPDRLLILPFGAIAASPLSVLRRVEAFCALPPHSYAKADEKVFASNPDISVPGDVRAALRERLQPQFDFLEANFPADFVELIR